MKHNKIRLSLLLSGILVFGSSCGMGHTRAAYTPELPVLPPAWLEILGDPHWRIEWLDKNGSWLQWEGRGEFPALSFADEFASPVLAWPFWPEKGITPGIMNPAGALFPWDIAGGRIVLGWSAGVDAFFWRELAANHERDGSTGTPRLPWYFDWPRFRELMAGGDIPDDVRLDPWTVDWKNMAGRTAESGFDRRRIRPEVKTTVSVSCPAALWIGSSPFALPVISTGFPFEIAAGDRAETWYSALGTLRVQAGIWMYTPW